MPDPDVSQLVSKYIWLHHDIGQLLPFVTTPLFAINDALL